MSKHAKPSDNIETDHDWDSDWFDEAEDSAEPGYEGRAARRTDKSRIDAKRALERLLEDLALERELDDYDGYLH